ncbi:hypothetical protein [Methanobacterium petrolearium]|uniref:hypothetical protein n=1 Tax=Methanobacterium petrolearium TaxID=710190 RepID=UPI001AE50BD1|nr:hypothetical protein [Methanobacterium petrolearium]MBP1946983.1 cytoskeletal protein RodZ [Methanobacterium petrolearium]BDZ71470.1 hypothetical protein GCM10025861_19870 [Methanobacterium petrolearium]
MTDDEISKGWWAQQSKGTKALIGVVGLCCIGLIVIVGLAGVMSPDATTSTDNTPETTSTGVSNQETSSSGSSYVEVSYPDGSWDGSITLQSGNNEEEINFDGSGTKRFDLADNSDKDVYVMAQKQDEGTGKLSAVVVRDGETKLTQSTTEGYGIVSGWVFSWE